MSGTLDNLSALYLQDPALASALRNRMYAEKLRAAGSDTSPIQSPWQGVNRLAQGLLGGFEESQSDKALKELSDKQSADLDKSRSSYNLPDALRGTPMPPMPPMAQAVAGQPAQGGASPIHMAESGGSMQPGIYGDGGAAAGPMQVHQAALADVNQRLGTNYTHPQLAADPAVGKQVGDEYHKMLLEQFGGDEAKAAAAYNAGPGRVAAAVQAYGNDWMRGIPQSAQSYVAKVTGGQGAAPSPAVNADAQRFDLMRQQGEFIQQQAMQNARNPNRQIAGEAQMQFERGKQMIAQAEAGMARVDARANRNTQTTTIAGPNGRPQVVELMPGGKIGAVIGDAPGANSTEADAQRTLLTVAPKITAGTATPDELAQYELAHRKLTEDEIKSVPDPTDPTGQRMVFARIPGKPLSASFPPPAGAAGAGVDVIPGTAKEGPAMTTDQAKSASYADRMAASNTILGGKVDAGTSRTQRALASIPGVGNSLVSSDYQQMEQAQRDFINAKLRQESGAAIADSEFENARKQYFPQPGDGPEVIAQKARNRELAIKGMSREAGPKYQTGPQGAAPSSTPAVPAPPSGFRVVQ